MHKIDGYGATVDNAFTEGDPVNAVPATDVTEAWLNAVQGEVVAVIEWAGIVLDKADNTQLLQAIIRLAAMGAGGIRTVTVSGPVLETDRIILVDATAGAIDLTFLSAANANAKALKIKRVDDVYANQVSLVPDGTDTLEWEAAIELGLKGETHEYIPDGVDNWLQF